MAEPNWLSAKIWDFLKLRAAAMSPERFARIKPEHWARLQSASRRGRNTSLRSRRRLVVYYIFLLSFYLPLEGWFLGTHAVRLKLSDVAFFAPLAFILAVTARREFRRRLPTSTLDEYATLNRESDFLALDGRERSILYLEYIRDKGRKLQDEYEADSRVRAQGTAYRFLTPLLVVTVAAVWAACLFCPQASPLVVLRMTADVAIWLASVALVAPMMIRMWTEPDNPGEPILIVPGQAVPAQKEA